MSAQIPLDVLVVGGGIAGLWTARRLQAAGHVCAVVEREALGAGQTGAAQGMIHGGLKYALDGRPSAASEALAAMPGRWRACLEGTGEVDLRGVRRLADACWLWADDAFRGRLATLLASRLLRGRAERAAPGARPPFLEHAAFDGVAVRLDEIVVDVPSLLDVLAAPLAPRLVRITDLEERLHRDASGPGLTLGDRVLRPRHVVLCAGAGNEALLAALGEAGPAMQRRPLHQVCVAVDHPHPVHGHCLTGQLGTEPRLTITSHPREGGGWLWYLGGALAGAGVERDRDAQIAAARVEVARALPWLDVTTAAFSTLRVDRAEPATGSGRRPDHAFVAGTGPVITTWPTKLTLAPDLADRVLELLPPPAGDAAAHDTELLRALDPLERPSRAPGFEARAA